MELLHRIRQGQAALAALSTGEPSAGPDRKDLDQFLASLPELWREGEARPTHRQGDPKVRYWRTREDPFKDVWTDILLWLQKEPDSSAKLILQKLDEEYPGQFEVKCPLDHEHRDRQVVPNHYALFVNVTLIAALANGHCDATPIRVSTVHCCLNEWRVDYCFGNKFRLTLISRAINGHFD